MSEEEALFKACAEYKKLDFVTSSDLDPARLEIDLVPFEFMQRSNLIMFRDENKALKISFNIGAIYEEED